MAQQPKRRCVAEEDEHKGTQAIAEKYTRLKDTVHNIAGMMLCRKTGMLPVDAVVAEDKCVYERRAIEEWFYRYDDMWDEAVESPVTGKKMGKLLFPVAHISDTARMLVEADLVVGEKASAWEQRFNTEKELEECLQKAESGDVVSMMKLGNTYRKGGDPQKIMKEKNYPNALECFKRAAELGNPSALAEYGLALMWGDGDENNVDIAQGFLMLGRAAEKKSELACYSLGDTYRHGDHGFKRNAQEAAKWYAKMQSCDVKDASDDERNAASEYLKYMDQTANGKQ